MQKSNAPTKLTVAFASGAGAGPVNTVPLTPGATPGTASYQTGFTSVNMEPTASGGVPPFGADFNGLFQDATKVRIWQQAGYTWTFDSAFAADANIGGYPAGSVLLMGTGKGLWINQADNNSQSPDATGSSGWLGLPAAGTYPINTTGGTTTPDPSALGVTTLLVTGALTSNATIVLPLSAGSRWIVQNNTTGSYTLTVSGATGTGVGITQGSALTVFTDGTNYFAASANLSGAYLPIDGTAVAATKLAAPRAFSITGLATAAGINFDGTGNVALNVTALDVAGALGYTPANDASVVHKSGTETITGAKTFGSGIGFGSNLATGADLSKHIALYSNLYGINLTNGAINVVFNGSVHTTFSNGAMTTQALTCTTFNATSSDRRLKRNIREFKARPLHRSTRFVSYTLKANGWNGLGAIAQEVRKVAPEHVGEFEQDGKKYLSLNYAGMAYEQAMWAGHEIDRLTKRIDSLERKLARASIQPRRRGLLRLLLEAIW